ncbi:YcgL domain-containing protein [Pseudomonadota bacterium]
MTVCKIFRSDNKSETYLYIADTCEFADLPTELQQHFGEPAFVMNLQLSAERKLARVDVGKVLLGLQECGYYLQLPPELPVEEEITKWLS